MSNFFDKSDNTVIVNNFKQRNGPWNIFHGYPSSWNIQPGWASLLVEVHKTRSLVYVIMCDAIWRTD